MATAATTTTTTSTTTAKRRLPPTSLQGDGDDGESDGLLVEWLGERRARAWKRLCAAMACSLCSERFAGDDDVVRAEECGHCFHRACLESFAGRKERCPCGAPVVPGMIKPGLFTKKCVEPFRALAEALERAMASATAAPVPLALSLSPDASLEPSANGLAHASVGEGSGEVVTATPCADYALPGTGAGASAVAAAASTTLASVVVPTMRSPDVLATSGSSLVDTPRSASGGASASVSSQHLAELQRRHAQSLSRAEANLAKMDARLVVPAPPPEPAPPKPPTRIVLLSSALPSAKTALMQELVAALNRAGVGGGDAPSSITAEIASVPSPDVTHLVVACDKEPPTKPHALPTFTCKPTFKYFWAVSRGLWVVRADWLDACRRANKWLAPEPFEVACRPLLSPPLSLSLSLSSAAASTPAMRNLSTEYRLAKLRGEPGIFHGKRFYVGPFPTDPSLVSTFDREQTLELLRLNGADVVELDADASGACAVSPASLERITEDRYIVLVGHPRDADHSDGNCAFCHALQESLRPGGECVEAAWIMSCLSARDVVEFETRVLFVVE